LGWRARDEVQIRCGGISGEISMVLVRSTNRYYTHLHPFVDPFDSGAYIEGGYFREIESPRCSAIASNASALPRASSTGSCVCFVRRRGQELVADHFAFVRLSVHGVPPRLTCFGQLTRCHGAHPIFKHLRQPALSDPHPVINTRSTPDAIVNGDHVIDAKFPCDTSKPNAPLYGYPTVPRSPAF